MADPHSTSDFTIAGTEHNVIVRYRPNQGRVMRARRASRFPASGYAMPGLIPGNIFW